jgi:hypothetical protein
MMSYGITTTSSSILNLLERLQLGGFEACKKRVPIVDLGKNECRDQLNTRRV